MKTILFLDDEEDLVEVFDTMFSSKQVSVKGFTSHHEALKYLESNSVDCVISDLNMPEISGQKFAALVKPGIPVYLCTGDIVATLPPNVKGLVTKPFNPEAIKALINALP